MRFNELQRALKTVTHRVLTAQLKDLEACGIVHRELFPAKFRRESNIRSRNSGELYDH